LGTGGEGVLTVRVKENVNWVRIVRIKFVVEIRQVGGGAAPKKGAEDGGRVVAGVKAQTYNESSSGSSTLNVDIADDRMIQKQMRSSFAR
jgi:hypothetical protein